MTILADTPCLANEPKKLNTSTVKQYKDVKTGFTYFREKIKHTGIGKNKR